MLAESGAPLLPHTEGKVDPGKALATQAKVQALMQHWEQAIESVKFLDPKHPKKLVPRMQHLFGRAQLSLDEVDMLRGLCTAMIKTARAAGHPIPEQRKEESAGPEQR